MKEPLTRRERRRKKKEGKRTRERRNIVQTTWQHMPAPAGATCDSLATSRPRWTLPAWLPKPRWGARTHCQQCTSPAYGRAPMDRLQWTEAHRRQLSVSPLNEGTPNPTREEERKKSAQIEPTLSLSNSLSISRSLSLSIHMQT